MIMRAFQWSAILMLALGCSVSAFIMPASSSSPRVASVAGADYAASPIRRVKQDLVRVQPEQRSASGLTVVAANRGGKGSEEGDEVEEKGGIEPK